MPADGAAGATTVLVTGASRGIGFAVARRLLADGASVVVTARKADALAAAVDELGGGAAAGRVFGVAGNTDDPDHRREVLDRIAADHGRLDVLVSATGMNPWFGPLVELDLGAARKVLEVNVISALGWVQDAVRHPVLRLAERGGAVVTLSSVTGETPSEGIGFYGVSKAALNQLTRTLAVELGPRVRVNAIAPAVVRTGFSKALYDGREEAVAAAYPLGRIGEPDDIAAAVSFLASADAGWITGQVLTLDGGLLAAGGRA